MSTTSDPTRRSRLDDESAGLDCFETEGVSVITEADYADFVEEKMLPAVRTVSMPASVRLTPPPTWRRRSWPGMRVVAVAAVVLLVGLVGVWMNVERPRPVQTVAVAPGTAVAVAPATPVTAAAPAAPSVVEAPPVPSPAVVQTAPTLTRSAPAVTRSRDAAAVPTRPASVAVTKPVSRPAATPVAISPNPTTALARPPLPDPTPAVAPDRSVAITMPEVVRTGTSVEAAVVPAAVVMTPPSDRASIEQVLQQYRDAYDKLDAPSAAVVWPRVDTRALSRAFSTLASQDVWFNRCEFDIARVRANAQCTGEIRYVQRVGDQTQRVRPMSWSFTLERVSDRWQIAQVTAN